MKRWKRMLLLAAIINFPVFAITGYGAQATQGQVSVNREKIERIRSLQKEIASFKGDFLIQTVKEDPANPMKETGKIVFKAPSFWRIEKSNEGSSTPAYTAGSNGKSFWNIDENDDDGGSLKKSNVERLSADQQNALIQATSMSPLCVFSEGLAANISSIADGQDNTWIFKIVPDKSYLSMLPAEVNCDEMRWEVSKETGLLKSSEWFYKGNKLRSIQFKNIKFETTLTTPRPSPKN